MAEIFQNLNNYNLTYAALLFPAIPLMMISFGNRYSTLSLLIRRIHDEFINKKITSQDKSATRYLSQLEVLYTRLKYILRIQTLSGIAFILNLLAILTGVFNAIGFSIFFFILAVTIFIAAIVLFVIEMQLAGKALKTHLEDLKEI